MNFVSYRNIATLLGILLALSACATSPTSTPTAAVPPTLSPTLPQPSPTNTALPPLPDFPEVLSFGGGGGPGSCDSDYPEIPDTIHVDGEFSGILTSCIFLSSLDATMPIHVTLSQPGTSETVLSSPDLIFAGPDKKLYWQYEIGGQIVRRVADEPIWGEDGTVKLPIHVRWPITQPAGTWRITLARAGSPPLSQDFEISKEGEWSDIGVVYAGSEEELMPANDIGGAPLSVLPPGDDSVKYLGADFPPNMPLYVLLYRDSYLVWKELSVADDSGMLSGQIPGSLAAGRYVLLATTNPADFTILDGLAYFTPKEPKGAAMDLFEVVPWSCPGAPPQRMLLGDGGRVCTQSDSVYLRDDASRSGEIKGKLPPGSQFTIVDGPACADNWSWWYIELEYGTWGWVAESGDETDPYFICPIP